MSGLVIREFSVQDLAGCVHLLQVGHDPEFSRQRFEWLHLKAPLAPSRIALAWDGARIVGCYAVIRKPMLFNGQCLIGGRDIDPVVHPEYRGRGVFQRLLQYGLQHFSDIDVFFNFANPAAAPGFLKQGWHLVGALQDRIFQIGHQGIAAKQTVARMFSLGNQLILFDGPSQATASEITLSSFADYPHLLPPEDGGLAQVSRDEAWLDWRYLEKPGHRYRFFVQIRNGQSERLYLLASEPNSDDLVLCDLLQAPAAVGCGFTPFYQALHRAGVRGKVKIWDRFHRGCLRQFIRKPLSRAGGVPVLVRQGVGREPRPELLALENWLFTHGDLEVV